MSCLPCIAAGLSTIPQKDAVKSTWNKQIKQPEHSFQSSTDQTFRFFVFSIFGITCMVFFFFWWFFNSFWLSIWFTYLQTLSFCTTELFSLDRETEFTLFFFCYFVDDVVDTLRLGNWLCGWQENGLLNAKQSHFGLLMQPTSNNS